MGSCVDDRNIRGDFDTVIKAFKDMAIYDTMAGHFNNISKLAMTSTTKEGKSAILNWNLGTEDKPE